MTDTGIFSFSPVSSSFGITGTGYWAAFNNIATGQGGVVPEPGSFLLCLPFGIVALFARRKRS